MLSEIRQGKKLDLAERKRSIESAGATKEKRKPVEQRTTGVSSIPEKKGLRANIVFTPAQLRNKREYPQCTLGNMSGSHSLSVINAEWDPI